MATPHATPHDRVPPDAAPGDSPADAGVSPRGAVALVTGAGNGIGRALALELAGRGAAAVAVCDRDSAAADRTAAAVRAAGATALALTVDVTDAGQVDAAFAQVTERAGVPAIVCSNVGVGTGQGLFASPEAWTATWSANVLGHVHVAQRAVPLLVRQGRGHLMITASAAGLLGLQGDAPYSVTKHAAVALAEWLAIAYGGRGVGFSALCPLGVRTDLLMGAVAARHRSAVDIQRMAPILEPEEVARTAVDAMADGRFLVLPHPEVVDLRRRRVDDPDGWIRERRPDRRRVPAGSTR